MAAGNVTGNEDRTGGQHSRRDFIKGAGLLAGGLIVGGSVGFAVDEAVSNDDNIQQIPSGAGSGTVATATPELPPLDQSQIPVNGLTFLTIAEGRAVQSLTSRIFPSDDANPGALEAGVVYFIDRQLSGSYGAGSQWYMTGPFAEGVATQGWQSHFAPADAYRAALRFIDEHCQQHYQHSFVELAAAQQDEVITALAAGAVDTFRGVTSQAFFALLQDNTLEGMYCDPMYGGNYNMVGWRMKRYPGSYVSYRDRITSAEFVELPPQPLSVGHLGALSAVDSGALGHIHHSAGHDGDLHPMDPKSYQAHN